MSDSITCNITGELEILAKLKLAGDLARQLVAEAANAGAQVIKDEANARAPGPHNVVKVRRKSDTQALAQIGPDKDHWYYRFFETGVVSHPEPGKRKHGKLMVFEGDNGLVHTRHVIHPGMAARPFLRLAVDTKADEATNAAGKVYRAGLERL